MFKIRDIVVVFNGVDAILSGDSYRYYTVS